MPLVRLVKNFNLNLMSVSVYVNLFIGHYEGQETNAKFLKEKKKKKHVLVCMEMPLVRLVKNFDLNKMPVRVYVNLLIAN